MSQYSPSKDLQSKSKSIYSDACQNESELNQIIKRRKRQLRSSQQRNQNNDNSFVKYNSREFLNVKNFEQLNEKPRNSSCEYKSFHEEKTENKENINDIDKNINIDENINHFEISSINSNSNNKNFMEENTDTELNKIFGITNSDKNSQKVKQSKDLKNNSQHNQVKMENSSPNYKAMNITTDMKNNYNNHQLFNSLYNNNTQFLKNNLTTMEKDAKNRINNKTLNKKEIINPMIHNIKFEGFSKDDLDKKYFDNKLPKIVTKSKNIKSEKNLHIKTLYELQNFVADDSSITAININEEGNLLGIGFQSGKIKVYEIMNYLYQKYKLNYCIKNLHEYLNFINETPYKTLSGHPNEILDLIWLQSNNNNIFMLSASLDLVILWNLSRANNFITRKYFHRQIILYISVNQVHKNILFVYGLLVELY